MTILLCINSILNIFRWITIEHRGGSSCAVRICNKYLGDL